jgi:glycosyltransferase involved in cell wall biosynthesis
MRPTKVSFINGIYYDRDAVSLVMRDQIRALSEAQYDIKIFVHSSDLADSRLQIVQGPVDILRNRHFRESQIVVFQWAVYYGLFDLVFAALPHQRILTYFHNTTPSRLFADGEARAAVERAERQIDNLFFSNFIFCNSAFSMNDLVARGIPRERMAVLTPAPLIAVASPARRVESGVARLLYVGRFVPQKGVRDLLLALARARRGGAAPFQLRMVGALRFSDKDYIDELMSIIVAEGLDDQVTFVGELSDIALGAEFAEAHALIMPSYHEGFCVPVVEAFNAGCYVIASDGGNLPYLVGDLGTIVAAGDIVALSAALADFVSRLAEPIATRHYRTASGELSVKAYEEKAIRYAARHASYEAFREQLTAVAEQLVQASEVGTDAGRRAASRDSGVVSDAPPANALTERLSALERRFTEHRKISLAGQNLIDTQRLDPLWRARLVMRSAAFRRAG